MRNHSIICLSALITTARTHVVPQSRQPSSPKTSRIFDREVDMYANYPGYNDLPLDPSYPTKAAWGVWGSTDELGALNHITEETILRASQEIRLGLALPLNMELDMPGPPPNPARKPLQHLYQPGDGYTDDVVVMNTQVSTQFDGLRHFPYSTDNAVATYRWYNDLIASYDDVIGPAPTEVLGMQVPAQKGIAVRAVLLDWAGWMDACGRVFDAFSATDITPAELEQVAEWQGLGRDWSLPGDMLILRTGWVRQYRTLNQTQEVLLPLSAGNWIGMEASEDSLRWLWEKKLSLVGADNPAFESTPFNKTIHGEIRSLHQIFIGGWGQNIVEFLDLEALTEKLHELNRWTFFLTIQNLNIVSGIASPPNALAIL